MELVGQFVNLRSFVLPDTTSSCFTVDIHREIWTVVPKLLSSALYFFDFGLVSRQPLPFFFVEAVYIYGGKLRIY
jgi:hypothetical protein